MICVLESINKGRLNYIQVFYGIITDSMEFITDKNIFYWDIRPDLFKTKREVGVKGYVNIYFDNKSDCVKEIIPYIFKH